ncbi:MAG TPA: prepilin-type N-terminal cleavage/methylation domain-containing protein [Patescibacteria group bacterium]|jgi:type II secretory pathway pseudopilin PulG
MKEQKNPKLTSFFLRKEPSGFSLIEILVITAVIAVLGAVLLAGYSRQLSRSRDAQRKDDLSQLRVVFEDYYNDNACYPDLTIFETCGSSALTPYLKEIPCDPQDQEPYVYFSLGGNECRGYRVLVQLENTNDPNIESMGCDATNGCYWDDPTYNFGIAMGGTLAGSGWEQSAGPTPAPTPTPTPTPPADCSDGAWVISPNGVCSCYANDYWPTAGCPATYATYEECFAVSGCTGSCTEQDVPLSLRCER